MLQRLTLLQYEERVREHGLKEPLAKLHDAIEDTEYWDSVGGEEYYERGHGCCG